MRGPVVAHSVEPDRALAGGGDDPAFVDGLRQMCYGMKTRGQAGEPYLRSMMRERFEEHAAALSVYGSHTAQVPVETTRLDQLRQHELVEAGCAPIAAQLLLGNSVRQCRRAENPAEADGRRQRLADRAQRRHSVRPEAL